MGAVIKTFELKKSENDRCNYHNDDYSKYNDDSKQVRWNLLVNFIEIIDKIVLSNINSHMIVIESHTSIWKIVGMSLELSSDLIIFLELEFAVEVNHLMDVLAVVGELPSGGRRHVAGLVVLLLHILLPYRLEIDLFVKSNRLIAVFQKIRVEVYLKVFSAFWIGIELYCFLVLPGLR